MARRRHLKPESAADLDKIAEKLLHASGVVGVLPTPLDAVADVKKLLLLEDDTSVSGYLSRLSATRKAVMIGALQKLRGAADLRKRVVYVPRDTNQTSQRRRFATAHEIAHVSIEWHNIKPQYFLDDNSTLTPSTKVVFEKEANYLGAGLIYQGKAFISKTRSVRPTISAIRHFADLHDASFQATAWQFTESSDEKIAIIFFYPTDTTLGLDSPMFKYWAHVGSPSFNESCGAIDIAALIPQDDEFVTLARADLLDNYHKVTIAVDGKELIFQAQSYWNQYHLTVLLRRPPRLRSLINRLTH